MDILPFSIDGSHYASPLSSFLLLKTKRKKKRTPASICRNRLPFSYRQKKKEKKKKATMNLPSHLRTKTGERTDSFFKKKKKERNECFLSDAEEEKRTENVLFSFPFIMKQKERTHSLSPFREEERKSSTLSFPSSGEQTKRKRKANVTFPSSFFPYRRRNGGSPFSLKKEKRKRREDGRTQTEGRRTKTKMGGKKGKG